MYVCTELQNLEESQTDDTASEGSSSSYSSEISTSTDEGQGGAQDQHDHSPTSRDIHSDTGD